MAKRYAPHQARRKDGYMSGFEAVLGSRMDKQGIEYEYEALIIPFVQPVKTRRYTPDFILPNGIVLEVKGQFQTADRQKHLMVKEAWPGLDIRFVFSDANQRISKTSKTTYAKWCVTKGFRFASKMIPLKWLREQANEESLRVLEEIRNHRLNTK